MVIFPSAAEWKETPDIEEGAVVREQQTLLMIPDLTKMQVKVGVHESKVGRLRLGMRAKVELQDSTLSGEVDEIAEVTRPAGWWTGNMVKYDTIIRLEPQPGLKPGMSAIVDIVLAEHRDVLKIPVAAIIQSPDGYLCWVKTAQKIEKRVIEVGDTNDEFLIVNTGIAEGDEVVLNPSAYLDEAQMEAMRPIKESAEPDMAGVDAASGDPLSGGADEMGSPAKDAAAKPASKQSAGAKILAAGDKDGDGALSIDEFDEKDRDSFSQVDSNGDGRVSASEIDAALQAAGAK